MGLRSILDRLRRRRQRLHRIKSIERPAVIHTGANFTFHGRIRIGKFTRIGNGCHLDGEGGIEVMDGAILASNVTILSSSHNFRGSDYLPYDAEDKKQAVRIGAGAWIGWGAIIMPGVTLGSGAIVGAGSVVTKDVDPGCVVGGNPAQALSQRAETHEIEDMVASEKFYLKALLSGDVSRAGRGDAQRYVV